MTHALEDRGADQAIQGQRGSAPLAAPLVFGTGLGYHPFALQSVHHPAYHRQERHMTTGKETEYTTPTPTPPRRQRCVCITFDGPSDNEKSVGVTTALAQPRNSLTLSGYLVRVRFAKTIGNFANLCHIRRENIFKFAGYFG
jgi:hypothetical protein